MINEIKTELSKMISFYTDMSIQFNGVISEIKKTDSTIDSEELEKLNELLNPQKFVKHKQELEKREKVLKILESKNIQSDIEKLKLKLQKIFLQCVENKIEKARK